MNNEKIIIVMSLVIFAIIYGLIVCTLSSSKKTLQIVSEELQVLTSDLKKMHSKEAIETKKQEPYSTHIICENLSIATEKENGENENFTCKFLSIDVQNSDKMVSIKSDKTEPETSKRKTSNDYEYELRKEYLNQNSNKNFSPIELTR